MTTQSHRYNLSRLAVAGAFLLAGLAGTAQAATASPHFDAGGPHGAGQTSIEGPSLVGSGPEREIVADETEVAEGPIYLEELGLVSTNDPSVSITGQTTIEGPSLVGSGPEREIVADDDDQQVAGTLDETARAIDLAVLSPHASTTIAVAPTEARFGQPF